MSDNGAEDVVILGGGTLGFSIAYHLSKEGINSQVIEMDSIAAKASGASDGIITNPKMTALYWKGARRLSAPVVEESSRSHQRLQLELKEETGLDVQYGQSLYLECALSEEEAKNLKGLALSANNEGFNDVKFISGDEARALENTLSAEIQGAVLLECGHVEPYRYTLALAQASEKRGASIRYGQAVGFRTVKNRVTSVILGTGTEVVTGTVVIAMGPWSGQAVSWLGLRLPLYTFRAHTLKLRAPKIPKLHLGAHPPPVPPAMKFINLISPRTDGTLMAGYTEDRTETWDDEHPETWSELPLEKMKDLMIEQIVRMVPVLEDAVVVENRAAAMPYPCDQGLIIGPVPKWNNVYIAVVGDGGLTRSPAAGRIITDLIVGGERAKETIEKVKSMEISPGEYIS